MNLLDIVAPECIVVPLRGTSKHDVISELVDLLAAAGKVDDAAALKDAVWAREQARTTGIGQALAIPHGKSESVPDLAMAIGKPAEPIDFESMDKKPVRLVVLLASPLDKTSDHIHALSQISRLMAIEEFRTKMYEASSAAEMYGLLQEQVEERAGA